MILRHGPAIIVGFLLALVLTSCSTQPVTTATGSPPRPAAQTPVVAAQSGCRQGNPLANVYHPYRLQVLSPCVTVTGTVAHVRYEQDGDYHINVTLDPQYAGMINNANRKFEYGNLVVEIVPADQPGCVVGQPPRPAHGSYDYGICTGADLQVPLVGQRVRVTGPYVLDTDHGWREIHPVWRLVQAPS